MNEDTNVVRLRFQTFDEAKANEESIVADFEKRWDGAFQAYDGTLVKIAADADALAKSAPVDVPSLFVQIQSVDIATRVVSGSAAVAAWQQLDLGKWSDGSRDALRSMDGRIAAGKLLNVTFDHAHIKIEAKVVDDAEWRKVEDGVYTGMMTSPAGAYLVDAPLAPGATFAVKTDVGSELRKFVQHPDWRIALHSLQSQLAVLQSDAAIIKSSNDHIRSALAIEKSKQDAVMTLKAALDGAVKNRDERLYGASAVAKRSLRFARANPGKFYGSGDE